MGYEVYLQARQQGDAAYQRRRENALQDSERATRQQAGTALAGADYAGAANALFAGGDLTGGMAVQNADRARQTADREQQRTAVLAVVTGLRHLPAEQRAAQLQAIGPRLSMYGVTAEQLATVTPQDLSDQGLDSLIAMAGGQPRGNAPSGFRYKADGTLEPIPGGPEAPENQRWQVTPYGLIPPPGWQPSQGQPQGQTEYVDQLPPGVRPRPNQPPSAPAAGGGERSQPVGVSFRSSQAAQSAIESLVPGVRVTSGRRSAAHNRDVGGAPGSFHLQDRARDLVPPAGMSMGQLAAKMRQAGFRVLDEGNHVHVSW